MPPGPSPRNWLTSSPRRYTHLDSLQHVIHDLDPAFGADLHQQLRGSADVGDDHGSQAPPALQWRQRRLHPARATARGGKSGSGRPGEALPPPPAAAPGPRRTCRRSGTAAARKAAGRAGARQARPAHAAEQHFSAFKATRRACQHGHHRRLSQRGTAPAHFGAGAFARQTRRFCKSRSALQPLRPILPDAQHAAETLGEPGGSPPPASASSRSSERKSQRVRISRSSAPGRSPTRCACPPSATPSRRRSPLASRIERRLLAIGVLADGLRSPWRR